MRILTLVLALLVPALVHAEAANDGGENGKRAFEITDYYRTAFVSQLALGTGGRVAFTVERYDLEKSTSTMELWTMDADGSNQRQLTFDGADYGSPTFSSDGRHLLFVSDRGGETSQLWLLPLAGGEARRLTDAPFDLGDPVFSPDGRFIAVTAEIYPECGVSIECHREIADAREKSELEVHVADELLYRHWDAWSEGKQTHVLLVDAMSGELVRDLTPGPWESPVFMLGGGRGYAFSPDSKELCFASNRDLDAALSTNADLWVVPVEGGEARNLTAGNEGWDGSPLYSPDGRYIAYRSQAVAGYEAAYFRLALYDRESGQTRYLTDEDVFENWTDEMAWTPDSQALYFQAPVKGRTPLFHYDLRKKKDPITEILVDAQIDDWGLLDDHLVYARRGLDAPREIYRVKSDGTARERLTDFNAALAAEVDLRPAEEMWVKGDGDYDVQVFVVKPHDFDPAKKYPLILNVHGGPQSQWSDSYRGDGQVYSGKGYVVAFPNPTGSIGRDQDYIDAIGCDWGGRVYRDLMKVTDALAALPYVDEKRLGAMGWSYGGYMMMWLQGHTDRFKAQAAMMGVYDLVSMWGATEELWFVEKDLCGTPWESPELYERFSPSTWAEHFKTPALVITGELDFRVPYTQSLQYFSALQRRRVPSRLVVFPKASHWPEWREMAFYYLVHLDWFHRHLGGGAPPWDIEAYSRNQVFMAQDGAEHGETEHGETEHGETEHGETEH